jgi:peptidoglycan/LPS O-acetylase OafA/YrhL
MPMTNPNHIPALDGLRALAVVAVIACHCDVLPFGWIGVDLFFVLSGFLITRILLRSKDEPHCLRNFYLRRALRIWPLYYGFLLLNFWIIPQWWPDRTPDSQVVYSTLLSYYNWYAAFSIDSSFAFPLWSLCVEEQFYLVWPLVVLRLSKPALTKVCIGGAALALLLRCGFFAVGFTWRPAYLLTPCRLDGLLLGALLAIKPSIVKPRLWLALSMPLLAASIYFDGIFLDSEKPYALTIGLTALAIAFTACLALCLKSPPKALEWPLMRSVGVVSYGMYVWHILVLFVALGLSQRLGLGKGFLPNLGLTYLIALASYYGYERWFLKLKGRFQFGGR